MITVSLPPLITKETTLHLSVCISNDLLLYFYLRSWRSLLYPLGKGLLGQKSWLKKDTLGKMLRLGLTDVNNLCVVENVKLGFAATLVYKKTKTTHANEVRNFKTNARNFSVHLAKKLKERSHYLTNSFYTFLYSHQPKLQKEIMIFWQIYLVSYVCISLNAIGYKVWVPIVLKPLTNLSLKAMMLRKEWKPLHLA